MSDPSNSRRFCGSTGISRNSTTTPTYNVASPVMGPSGAGIAAAPAQLTTFDIFPKFVLDLRIMIWEAALPSEPRLIPLMFHPHTGTFGTRPPALLHVSQEAREIALKHYHIYTDSAYSKIIYLSPQYDTIFIGNHFCRSICREVRHANEYHNFSYPIVHNIFAALRKYKGLRSDITRIALGWEIVTAWREIEIWRRIENVDQILVCWDLPARRDLGFFMTRSAQGSEIFASNAQTIRAAWSTCLQRPLPAGRQLMVETVEVVQSDLLP